MQFIIYLFSFFFTISNLYCTENNKYFTIDINRLVAIKKNNLLVGSISDGKKIFSSRKVNCLSCHEAPIEEEKFQGNFGPSLLGIGALYNKDELRLRIINAKIINPDTIMPAYFIKINNKRTPKKYLNKTILSAQEVEDLVEYLYSLK